MMRIIGVIGDCRLISIFQRYIYPPQQILNMNIHNKQILLKGEV